MSRARWWRRPLAYIDDWFSTPSVIRAHLEEVCSTPSCAHARYQHGQSRTQRIEGTSWSREIANTPGTCTACRCKVFAEPNAVTEDEVLDFAESLEHVNTMEQLFAQGGALG